MNNKVPGGYIVLARRLFQSGMMEKPPLYLKLWVWMLDRAMWKDGNKLKRGQFVTTIAEMQKAMSYKVGYRKRTPTKGEIRSAYEAFVKDTMVTTTKTTRGMIVTIVNYDTYQNPANYEPHTEQHNEHSTNNTVTTHDREEGEERNKPIVIEAVPGGEDSPPPTPPAERVPHRAIVDLFHKLCPTLPRVKDISATRQETLRVRWRDKGGMPYFEELFTKVNASDFLSGRDGKWNKCSFDWVIKSANSVKIMEGNYDNKVAPKKQQSLEDLWRQAL